MVLRTQADHCAPHLYAALCRRRARRHTGLNHHMGSLVDHRARPRDNRRDYRCVMLLRPNAAHHHESRIRYCLFRYTEVVRFL